MRQGVIISTDHFVLGDLTYGQPLSCLKTDVELMSLMPGARADCTLLHPINHL